MFRKLSLLVVTALLTWAHLWYSWRVSIALYSQSGGVVKQPNGWTRYGGAPYAWTIPLVLPGTLLMRIGQTFHSVSILGGFGMIAILAASVITAYAVASCLFAVFSGKRVIWGTHHWRLVVILLGLIWMPIREDWAEVYQYTVLY